MEIISCYTMAQWMIEDAEEKYGFVSSIPAEKIRGFCAKVDSAIHKFGANGSSVSVDADGVLHVSFVCPEIVVDDKDGMVFFDIVRESSNVVIKKESPDGEEISVEFCCALRGER